MVRADGYPSIEDIEILSKRGGEHTSNHRMIVSQSRYRRNLQAATVWILTPGEEASERVSVQVNRERGQSE